MDILENIFTGQVMSALGWTVLHSLWQAFLVALILSAFQFFLRKKGAHLLHTVGYVALMVVLTTSVITFFALLDQGGKAVQGFMLTAESAGGQVGLDSWLHRLIGFCDDHLPAIVLVWLMGVVIFSLRFAGGLIAVQRLKYRNSSPVDARWQELLQAIRLKIGVDREVVLLESLAAGVPMVIG